MTHDQLQYINQVAEKLVHVKSQINQLDRLDDAKNDPTVKTRIRGMDIELPKAAFKSEVNKKKNELESQLTILQAEFDAL